MDDFDNDTVIKVLGKDILDTPNTSIINNNGVLMYNTLTNDNGELILSLDDIYIEAVTKQWHTDTLEIIRPFCLSLKALRHRGVIGNFKDNPSL